MDQDPDCPGCEDLEQEVMALQLRLDTIAEIVRSQLGAEVLVSVV